MQLNERAKKLLEEKDINLKDIEDQFEEIQGKFRLVDQRRVTQQSEVEHDDGASDSDKIDNLTTAMNSFFTLFNESDLTEED